MGRVYFPTTSLNRFGVRDTDQRATLSGAIERFPAEPTPRSAMNPTPPILGGMGILPVMRIFPNGYGGPNSDLVYAGTFTYRPPVVTAPRPVGPRPIVSTPIAQPLNASGPISSSGGGGAAPTPPVPQPVSPSPVSTQVLPTPTVTLPAPPPSSPLLVSSGGGTQTPATPTTVAPTTGLVDGIAAWLGGTTSLFNYNVPNALLAGVVVLGFAWLSSGTGKKR